MSVVCKNCGGAHPVWDCSKLAKIATVKAPEPIVPVASSKALFDRSAYQRQYMADLRTIKRLGLSVTVSQYRKSKENENV